MVALTASNFRFWAQPLLGCNVYISAGGLRRHHKILNDLLKGTQDHCSLLMRNDGSTTGTNHISGSSPSPQSPDNNSVCVVVHAFSDQVYNRSSFHLAGTEKSLPVIVSNLINDARQKLSELRDQGVDNTKGEEENSSSHPFVGLVDHISVMPLEEIVLEDGSDHDHVQKNAALPCENQGIIDEDHNDDGFEPPTPWGRVAREIGKSMTKNMNNVNVFYYGDADPDVTSLADVRRLKTNFFHSGGLTTTTGGGGVGGGESAVTGKDNETTILSSSKNNSNNNHNHSKDTATVGAPANFVENYNIRLTSRCDKKTAQSLTRFVRERDGGLVGVEALTLPYSRNGQQLQYEVACNLTRPKVGSSDAIDEKVKEWVSGQMIRIRRKEGNDDDNSDNSNNDDEEAIDASFFVEKSYRVGTTSKQCLEVLKLATTTTNANDDDEEDRNKNALHEHNLRVQLQLERYLNSSSAS